MKVALCIRKDYLEKHGGDSVQLLHTKAWMERLFQVETIIVTDPGQLDRSFDIIHIFNLATRETTAAYFDKAKSLGIKTALSTIFWDYTYQATKDFASAINYRIYDFPGLVPLFVQLDKLTALIFSKPRIISSSFRHFVMDCLNQADHLLPNSIEELQHAADFARLEAKKLIHKTTVVLNATEPGKYSFMEDFHEVYQLPRNYILQVGRIEYIKNQLVVIEALKKDPEMPVVFLGRPNGEKYFKIVKEKAEGRGNVFFRDEVPHNDIHLFYKNARLHVLPSLRESPGLVNLEALQNGCPIVVSNKNFLPFDTYFRGIATAVDPLSPASVRDGIMKELCMKRDMPSIKQLVKERFSWEQAARQTYQAYQAMLKDPA